MKEVSSNKLTFVLCVALILLISTPLVLAEPPDNAALLYYQAFLLYKKPEVKMDKTFHDFRRGKIKANEKIKAYIQKNRRVIDLVVTAADMPNCDWGYDYSKGTDLAMPGLAQFRNVTYLILAEARLLAKQGDYKLALHRCLTIKKIGRHAVDKPLISYLTGLALGGHANKYIQDILADMPRDLKILNWFKDQLLEIGGKFPPFKTCVAGEAEIAAMQFEKAKLEEILEALSDESMVLTAPEFVRDRIANANEEFIVRNKDYYLNSYIPAVQAVLDMSTPYPETYKELEKLDENVQKDAIENPDATLTVLAESMFSKVYSSTTRNRTLSNAIKTALEIYIIRAKTGKLPDKLPLGLPKDLFSGDDFEYKKRLTVLFSAVKVKSWRVRIRRFMSTSSRPKVNSVRR